MELVEIVVLVIVWLVCHWVYDWWTRCRAETGGVVVVIFNGQSADEGGHASWEPNHDGAEGDANGHPCMIEVGDLRIKAYPRIREWHRLGAVNVREGS